MDSFINLLTWEGLYEPSLWEYIVFYMVAQAVFDVNEGRTKLKIQEKEIVQRQLSDSHERLMLEGLTMRVFDLAIYSHAIVMHKHLLEDERRKSVLREICEGGYFQ